MFIGHYAVALSAKKIAPGTSLGTFFLATSFADLLWPIFLLLGIEHVRIAPGITLMTPFDFYDYPYSHSLGMLLFWSALFGGILYAYRRNLSAALIVGGCVFSHWILDFVVHRPDLPLYPGGSVFVGLGLWNSRLGTYLLELSMFLGGAWMYATSTAAKSTRGNLGYWSFIGFLLIVYFLSFATPPPPSVGALAIGGEVGAILIVFIAYWIDKHRVPVAARSAPAP